MPRRRPTPADRLLDAADDLEALLTCPTSRSARRAAVGRGGPSPSVDLRCWRLHVCYHRRRRSEERQALIAEYHSHTRRLSRRYFRHGEPSDDLEQVALEALLLALERFDPTRSLPFLGYANPTIVGALKRHYRDTGWAVRVPRRAHELSSAVRDAEDLLTQDLQRAPTDAEVSDLLGVPMADVMSTRAAQHARAAASLDAPAPGVDGDLGVDPPADDGDRAAGSIGRAEDRVAVESVIRMLQPRTRELLGLYFEDQLSQAEIARRMGVSQMQVSRWLSQALQQIRSHLPDG